MLRERQVFFYALMPILHRVCAHDSVEQGCVSNVAIACRPAIAAVDGAVPDERAGAGTVGFEGELHGITDPFFKIID